MYGLKEKVVRGDGNCQFRALADQLFNDANRHEVIPCPLFFSGIQCCCHSCGTTAMACIATIAHTMSAKGILFPIMPSTATLLG